MFLPKSVFLGHSVDDDSTILVVADNMVAGANIVLFLHSDNTYWFRYFDS